MEPAGGGAMMARPEIPSRSEVVDVRQLFAVEMLERLAAPVAASQLLDVSGLVLLVTDDGGLAGAAVPALRAQVALLPAVVVGLHDALAGPSPELAAVSDLVLPTADPAIEAVLATVERNPLSAQALLLHLRAAEGRPVAGGLVAESAVYSTLQAGPEFAEWRRRRPRRARAVEKGPVVSVSRADGHVDVVLRRPASRNALNAQMRDELLEALALVAGDPSIEEVHLRGEGPSFCSGGDLDEFGTFPDPATAHLVRVSCSIGRAIDALADRVVAHLHGACFGSGIELPAFAQRVYARAGTSIALPEVGLGLVPGAGGTVSLPRRIGRHRTALLALTGTPIDVATALDWGLVDQIEA